MIDKIPQKGSFLLYKGSDVERLFKVTGTMKNNKTILRVEDVETGMKTYIIAQFPNKEFNNRLSVKKEK